MKNKSVMSNNETMSLQGRLNYCDISSLMALAPGTQYVVLGSGTGSTGDIDVLTARVSALESQVSALSSSLESQINTLNSAISSLDARVTALENGSGGGSGEISTNLTRLYYYGGGSAQGESSEIDFDDDISIRQYDGAIYIMTNSDGDMFMGFESSETDTITLNNTTWQYSYGGSVLQRTSSAVGYMKEIIGIKYA